MKNTIYKNTTSSHYRVSRLGLSVHYHHFISFAMYTHNSHRRILAQIFAQVIDIYAQRTCIKIRISSPYAHQYTIAIHQIIHTLTQHLQQIILARTKMLVTYLLTNRIKPLITQLPLRLLRLQTHTTSAQHRLHLTNQYIH